MLHAQTRGRSVHVHGFTAGQKIVENQGWAVAGLFLAKNKPKSQKISFSYFWV